MAALYVALLFLAAPLTLAAPPSGGETLTVDQTETWSEDGTFDGHVTVQDGAVLTINANITMETGSSINVEQGGQLVLTNGGLYSNDLNAGVMINSALAELTLNFGDLADVGVLQLKLDHEIPDGVMFDITYDETTINASGTDLVQFDVPLNNTDLSITFTSYYFTPTYVLWAKAIHSGGDTSTLMAPDIEATNAPLYWFQSAYDLVVDGELSVTSADIEGANISCSSLCAFDSAVLTGSAPVHAAPTASIAVMDSVFDGSRSDEDIILHDQAQITYTNSQGTGGTTDAWIRLLSHRELTTNIPNGSLDISGIGWGASNWNDLTDENGYVMLVPSGQTNEHKRIVEWMDGEGVVHQEDASITLSISSSWGTFSSTIAAPTTSSGSIELALPFIAVTEVTMESDEAIANKSISGMATVSNTGDVAASSVSVWCYVGEDVAETTQITVSLNAGETKQVPFTWYAYEAGDKAITCKPLLPTLLNEISDMVVNLDGATSTDIAWEYADEEEDSPLIIYLALVLGIAALVLFTVAQTRGNQKTYQNHQAVEAHDDGNEFDEKVADDQEEGSSVYDLKPEDEA